MKTVSEINAFVRDMKRDELDLVITAVKNRDRALSQDVMMDFGVGDKVYFMHKNRKYTGKILSAGRTKFSVSTEFGQFRVPATWLKALDI